MRDALLRRERKTRKFSKVRLWGFDLSERIFLENRDTLRIRSRVWFSTICAQAMACCENLVAEPCHAYEQVMSHILISYACVRDVTLTTCACAGVLRKFDSGLSHVPDVNEWWHTYEWCCFYYLIRNCLVDLLEALFTRTPKKNVSWHTYKCILQACSAKRANARALLRPYTSCRALMGPSANCILRVVFVQIHLAGVGVLCKSDSGLSHVSDVNESCHACECVMAHTPYNSRALACCTKLVQGGEDS